MSDDTNPQDATTPRKGGFGAFSQQYRDRWAANHPNAKKTGVDGNSTPTPETPAAQPTLPDRGTVS